MVSIRWVGERRVDWLVGGTLGDYFLMALIDVGLLLDA